MFIWIVIWWRMCWGWYNSELFDYYVLINCNVIVRRGRGGCGNCVFFVSVIIIFVSILWRGWYFSRKGLNRYVIWFSGGGWFVWRRWIII